MRSLRLSTKPASYGSTDLDTACLMHALRMVSFHTSSMPGLWAHHIGSMIAVGGEAAGRETSATPFARRRRLHVTQQRQLQSRPCLIRHDEVVDDGIQGALQAEVPPHSGKDQQHQPEEVREEVALAVCLRESARASLVSKGSQPSRARAPICSLWTNTDRDWLLDLVSRTAAHRYFGHRARPQLPQPTL